MTTHPRSPWSWLSPKGLVVAWLLAAGVGIAVATYLNDVGRQLHSSTAPRGVVSLEIAGDAGAAQAIVAEWKSRKVDGDAVRSVQVDFAFLVLYPVWLSLGAALFFGWSRTSRLKCLWSAVSWAALVAAPLDAVENIGLLRMLETGGGGMAAPITAVFAWTKFLVAGTAAAAVAIGFIARGLLRMSRLLAPRATRGPA